MSTKRMERAGWLGVLLAGLVATLPLGASAAEPTSSARSVSQMVSILDAASSAALVPSLESASPHDGASDVAPSARLSLRFNVPIDAKSLNGESVTLLGPAGAVAAAVTLLDDGRTVSVVPRGDLFPQTRYTVFVKGVSNAHGVPVPLTAMGFTTATLAAAPADPHATTHAATTDDSTPTQNGYLRSTSAGKSSMVAVGASAIVRGDTSTADDERWQPSAINRNGNWRTGRPLPDALALRRNEAMAPLSLAPGGVARAVRARGTAVTGIVLRQNDLPLANVNVSIGTISAQTGNDGEFVLTGLRPGQQELIVDGRSAGDGATTQYGYFVIGVNVQAGKDTEVAPIYLPKIIQSDWVDLPSPIAADTVVTTSTVPGMEIHIPKGAVLRDREGKLVTKIALVPMPLDRMPFPFPENAPVFVGVQPGGMIVQGLTPGTTSGITVHYPNESGLAVRTRVNFWSYNTDTRGWQIYGNGQVTDDAAQVVPDAGVALYESIGFMFTSGNPPPPPDAPPPDGHCNDPPAGNDPPPNVPDDPSSGSGDGNGGANTEAGGDPVDCKSGLFVLDRQDVRARGIVPLEVTRTYRPGDPTGRAFGYGQNHGYAMYLRDPVLNGQQYQKYDLILPDGSFVRFNRTSPGTGYTEVVALHNDSASDFYGAILAYENPSKYVVTKKNGTRYVFSLYGTLDAIQDRVGNTVTVSRSSGQITRLTAAGGRYIDFTYDSASRITQMEDVAGRTWGYTYSAAGYLTRITYPDSLHEDYAYDSAGRMLTITNRKGVTIVTNVYDANGRVSQQTLADGAVYHFAYTLDGTGKVTQTDVTDPRSHIKRVTYDSHGYKASVTRAYGTSLAQTTTYERDPTSGLLSALVDPLGRRTEFQRDGVGNITQRTRLAGTANLVVESYTYTPQFSRLASYTDPRGKITTFTYDALGNRLSWTDPLSHSRTYTYNSAGQLVTAADALSNTTRFNYDPTGDLRSVTEPLNRTTTFYIDGLGRNVGTVDPLGRKTLWTFDTMGRKVTTTDPMGQSATLTYDANGQLLSVTDPNGGTTQYAYDGRNRRTSRTDALNQSESWTFDGMGNALTYVDRKSQQTQYQYDVLDRRTLTTYADGSTVATSYDAGNRLLLADDSVSGTINRTYDGLDRLTLEQTPQGTVGYIYDVASRRTQMTAASQSPITYSYDDANRLTSIVQSTETVSFTYDDADRRTTIALPGNIAQGYSYDAASQISSMSYGPFGTGSGGLGFVTTVLYTYDPGGQRVSAGSFGGDFLPAATTGTNLFDLNNRQTQTNGFGISYDPNGDPTVNNTPVANTYTFDVRHRLTKIQQGSTTIASFQYDAFGRRIGKKKGVVTTNFLYDGHNAIQEQDVNDNPLLATPPRPILTGLNIDERYARTEGSGRRYFLTDALGSTVGLTDATGTIQQTYSYEPYGEVQAAGSSTNPYQFTGRENDGVGLYYYRARYYSPVLKRFISEDPMNSTKGLNFYAYVDQDPLSYIDPLGLEKMWVCSRPIDSWYGAVAPDHQYVCCAGPNTDCYGHANNHLKKGDPIPHEADPTGTCEERDVSPENKKFHCDAPISPCDGSTINWNCSNWANSGPNPTCPAH